jgi:type II secretory pathway predicted ATPase ExeA/septal ring-binding cell division protein DamX
MYLEHFGLDRPPFKITPDTSMFFEGSKRGAALDALIYAIKSGEGIIKVVGEVGSGKTMLCRMLELKLSDVVDIVYIAHPSLSPENILHVIAHELHLDVRNDDSKLDVMQKLQDYLLQKHAGNRQVVVFVEEAQSMPVETLEEIRFLSNLETDQHKLLQMVLFGQPELDEKLAQPQIRQLKERITHSFFLDPFPPEDTLDYLNFRLRSVGYRGPSIFNQRTANAVEKYSSGLSRRINIIADKALMASFSEGTHEVSTSHVATAAKDSDFTRPVSLKPILKVVGAIVALLLALWLGSLLPGWINPVGEDVAFVMPPDSKQAISGHADVSIQQPQVTATAAEATPERFAKPETVKNSDEAAMESGIKLSLLNQRLDETEKWLEDVADDHYSIQLFMTQIADGKAVEQFLREPSDLLDFQKIYVYETRIGGSRMYSVLYNDFDSRKTARSILQNLPAEMRASKPFLRRVSALRKDLESSG